MNRRTKKIVRKIVWIVVALLLLLAYLVVAPVVVQAIDDDYREITRRYLQPPEESWLEVKREVARVMSDTQLMQQLRAEVAAEMK